MKAITRANELIEDLEVSETQLKEKNKEHQTKIDKMKNSKKHIEKTLKDSMTERDNLETSYNTSLQTINKLEVQKGKIKVLEASIRDLRKKGADMDLVHTATLKDHTKSRNSLIAEKQKLEELNAQNLLQLDQERLNFICVRCNAQTYQPITNQLTNNLLRYPNTPPGFTQTTISPSTGFAAAIPPISVAPQVNSYMQSCWIPNPAAPPPPSTTALQMNPYGQLGWAPNPAAPPPPPATAPQVNQ
jgi:hypothetical protein